MPFDGGFEDLGCDEEGFVFVFGGNGVDAEKEAVFFLAWKNLLKID